MSKAAEPLDSNEFAEQDVLLPDRVEDGDARTQDRSIFYRIDVFRNSHHGLRAEKNIFCIATVHRDAIYGFMLAHLKEPTLARLADMIVTWRQRQSLLVSCQTTRYVID
jgi:hypothetical protein